MGRNHVENLRECIGRLVSGQDIFELLFRPILHSFLEYFPFHFINVSFMTLKTSRLTNKTDLLWKMLTVYRTKRGSIR